MSVELHMAGALHPCGAENISRTGVLLIASPTNPLQERVDITLRLPGGGRTIRIPGRIVRDLTDASTGKRRIAVAFLKPTAVQAADLEALIARLLEAPFPTTLGPLRVGASHSEIVKSLETLPLSQRISTAMRGGMREREALRHDTAPAVQEALARNPNLTLPEARAWAASTSLLASTIPALAADARFARDEEFCLALAANSRVTVEIADGLTAHFNALQVRRLLGRPGISGALRSRLLKRHPRG